MAVFDGAHALAFLAAVFTSRPGLVQICSTGNWTGRFFPTSPEGLDQAVEYAALLDTRRPQGIYFRATTVRAVPEQGKRGGAEDTLTVPMLWADVDYGTDGHKGATLPPTRAHASTLHTDAGLPEATILVHSGGGYYPLWVTSGLAVEDAAQASVDVQLVILAESQRRGWQYGTGVSDLARVLRLPGSINRKTDEDRPCYCVGGTGYMVDVTTFPKPPELAPAATTAVGVARPLPVKRADIDPNRPLGAFDHLGDLAAWADILEPAGWTLVAVESDGAERWLRPGGSDSEYSARAFEHNLVCHSESAGLPAGAGQRLTKGRVYAYLWHGGDLSAASRDLMRGDNVGGLPGHIVAAIQDALGPWTMPALTVIPRQSTVTNPLGTAGAATAEELATFLNTYTRFSEPRKLGLRTGWAKADPGHRLTWHARCLVDDVLAGHYPARKALAALSDAYRHHGGLDPAGPLNILSAVLGAVLNAKVSA